MDSMLISQSYQKTQYINKLMRILLSNDDGYLAEGIQVLSDTLSQMGELTVVAPDRNRSAASNSLTLSRPIRVHKIADGFYKVDGTPTDCVHLGITGLLKKDPDIVVAGINAGANLGDDVLYSGTVAAATEGRFMGFPGLAVSLAGTVHYASAAKAVRQVINKLINQPLDNDSILNINVPDLPWGDIKGIKATRLGCREKSEPIILQYDPYGTPVYWVGRAGKSVENQLGSDFDAVHHGYISITPLQIDMTRQAGVKPLQKWLDSI